MASSVATPSPFARLAASPLAAAFPCSAAAATKEECSSGSAHSAQLASPFSAFDTNNGSDDDFACFDSRNNNTNNNTSSRPAHAHGSPKRCLTAGAAQRAGSYCLAGSLTECRAAKALGRVSCGPACGGESCSTDPSTALLPQHMSLPPFRDLDALLAAASCKPGFNRRASTDLMLTANLNNPPAVVPEEDCQMMVAVPEDDAGVAAAGAGAAAATAMPVGVAAVLEQYGAMPVGDGAAGGIADAALGLIAEHTLADTFYLYDLGEVARLFDTWVTTMPRVKPFYAVKCNPEPSMVAMLAALGAGFDCASIQELQLAAAHGVTQDRIIFANPCKRPADFRYAAEHAVGVTTFDCVSELHKIAAGYPSFKCVLRIRCDDASAKINLGLKYGADMSDVPMLLGLARDLGLQVVGVSFHVGSGCQNVGVYADAIAAAREAFDMGASFGFPMELLDIGGGFTAPYDEPSARLFYTTAAVINSAIDHHFPPGCGVRIIAEPGRYFAETSATLFTTILGQREGVDALGGPFRDYWLSDGTYGSFRIQVAVDGLEPTYSVLRSPLLPGVSDGDASTDGPPMLPCRLWGNSDRDGDVVHKAALLPALRDGDWLMFPFAGAYTICAASNYGGVRFTQPLKLFIYSGSVHRETEGFDMAAGVAAAAAAVWHNNPSNTSCCGSEGGAVVSGGAAVSVSVDSDSSSNSGDSVGAGGSGSPHSVGLADGAAGKCSGADDGGVVCCLLCGGGGCGLVSGGEGEEDCATPKGFSGSCVCGGGLGADGGAVDDGCMSVASDGTAATVLVGMEGCADSLLLQEPDITSMIIV